MDTNMADDVTIQIKDGATIQIKDGATIQIKDGATVQIEDGATVQIEDGATVQIEDGAIPVGYRLKRIAFAKAGETIVWYDSKGRAFPNTLQHDSSFPELIICKEYDCGIKLRKGWWLWNNDGDWVASPIVGDLVIGIYGMQDLLDFIPPPDGQPRQIT